MRDIQFSVNAEFGLLITHFIKARRDGKRNFASSKIEFFRQQKHD